MAQDPKPERRVADADLIRAALTASAMRGASAPAWTHRAVGNGSIVSERQPEEARVTGAAVASAELPRDWRRLAQAVSCINEDHGPRTLEAGMAVRVTRTRVSGRPSQVEVKVDAHDMTRLLGAIGGHAFFRVERDALQRAL